MAELEQDIDFSSAIVGAQKPAPVKKKVQPQVVSTTTSDLKSVSQPTKSLSGSQLKEDKEEVGMIDDLWNSLKGAGAKALASITAIPQFAQNAAMDIVASTTGRSSEFNKLPSAAKKQIRDAVTGALSQGATGVGQLAGASQEATDYLNKKSEDIYKKTRQEEIDVVDELSKFKDNPNLESAKKVLYQGLKTSVESIPYMAIGMASLPALAVTSAAGKREEDITKEGDVGIGNLLNAGIYGGAEAVFEGATNKILRKAGNTITGNPVAAKALAEGFVKSIFKDFGQEASSEGATTFIQDLSDKITKGEDPNFYKIAKNVANSAILGGISGGGISLGSQGLGAARKYVASKIMPKNQIEQINGNIKTIQSLNLEHGDDVDPRVNKIVNKKIDELVAENEAIIAENEAIATNLSAEQVKQIFDIDDKLDENFNSAKSIIDDTSMDKSAKELLLEDLLKQQNNLKQEKDAIQKQTTSQIPVQPETGVSGEVAQGVTQAEPEGTAEEVKTEEVVTPTETIEVFHGGNLPSLEEGKPLYVSEDASQANEYAEMSKGEVSKFFLDKNKIANEEDAYAVMEELGLPTDANFFELVDPRFEEALPEEDIQKVYDTLKEKGFEAVRYTDIDQKTLKPGIQNILVIDASKSLKSEPVVAEEQVKPTEETQVNAVQKGIDAVNKALQRGRPRKEAVQGGIAYMQQTVAYEQADDVTREQMLRDINKEFGVKEKKAPSAKKVLGEPTQKKVTVNEMTALKDQIKLEAKAAKGAEKATDQVRKDVVEKIKSMITRGALSKPQQKSLLNSLAKTNILNPVMRERLFERMDKMFKRADYQDRIKEATTFRNKIKKLAKSDTLQASVAKMAKDFGKVIPEFTDIDTYLENARQVYDAIKKPVRKAASIEAVSAFTADELAKQEEKVKNTLLDQYDYLAEAGLIDASMSLAEIQSYVMSVEAGTAPDTIENEAEIRGNIKELFNSMTDITDSILEDGFNPLTNEELELDAYTKKLLKNFTSMDLDLMSIRDSYRAAEALENYIVNDIVDNMETMYRVYEGARKAEALEKKGIVAQSFRRVFGGKAMNSLSRMWTSSFSPIKSILDLVHRSRKVGSDIFRDSGLRGLSNESSKAKKMADRIDEAYDSKFKNTKPNGKKFYDIENVFERQIYAYLSRSSNGDATQIQKEFNDRKGIIEQSIENDLKSGNSKLEKKAKVAESIYNKIKNSSNIDEIKQFIDPINIEAAKWWSKVYSDIYPKVKKVASSVYNIILEDDINYTPDIFEQTSGAEVKTASNETPYKMEFDYLNQKPSGTLMKNNRIKVLPKNRSLSFDFDYNNSTALRKMLVDIETAPSFQQYRGFVESPSFEKIYPDPTDRALIKDRMNYYVYEVRSKNVAGGSIDAKKWAKIVQSISRYGTARSLGSLTAGVKQAGTALVNTSINLINDLPSVQSGVESLYDKDAQDFLENSGYDIANRGLESQTAIESANRIIEKANIESIDNVVDALGKTNKIYVENFLKNGDIIGARASWMAYYIHKLKKLGYNTDSIDWKNHELVEEAGDYAEDQINLHQNVSDSAMMGKLLNSKNPWITIARSTVIPFSSFIFNAKDRMTTDVTILTSKNSSNQDKVDAFKSLAATTGEMLSYEAAAATISSLITIAAYYMLGQEEDEEERNKRRKMYVGSGIKGFITDVLSPIPNIGDIAIIAAANSILNYAQKDLNEEDKFLLFEYKPESESDGLLNIIGGIPYAAAKPFVDMGDTIYKISSDSYQDKYGNEITLSNEDKQKMALIFAAELVGAFNILPSEVVRLVEKVKQQIEKEAR